MELKRFLKTVDALLNEVQPYTDEHLVNLVLTSPGAGKYGFHFTIVKYMGALQGIRVYVTSTKLTHCLPTSRRVYATMQGTEKYQEAGWEVENEPMNP